MEYVTKDGRALSHKQVKVLLYNGFNLTLIKDMMYKEVSNKIGKFIAEYEDAEATTSIDGFEEWDCPIDPWGN